MRKFLTLMAATITILGFTGIAWADGLSTQDYIDIEQLYATYNHAIDAGDGEAWAGTFTADGTFNKFTGHDQLVGFIQRRNDLIPEEPRDAGLSVDDADEQQPGFIRRGLPGSSQCRQLLVADDDGTTVGLQGP